jgi:hypothetical protein
MGKLSRVKSLKMGLNDGKFENSPGRPWHGSPAVEEPGNVGISSSTRNSGGGLRESQPVIGRERRKHQPQINRRRVCGGSKGKVGKAGRAVRNVVVTPEDAVTPAWSQKPR